MLTNTKESLEKFRKFVAQQSRSRLTKGKKNVLRDFIRSWMVF